MRISALAEQTGSPAPYAVRVADLVPTPARCAWCGRACVALNPALTAEQRGDWRTPAATLDLLGGLTKYINPSELLCEACELDIVAQRLFPPAPHQVETPIEAELRSLRERLDGPPAPPAPTAVGGGLFDPGAVRATPTALAVLAKAFDPRYRADVVGIWELGRAHVPTYVGRSARGDWGSCGSARDADAGRGERLGPLACRADRNAAAARSGRGAVLGLYHIGNDILAAWTATGPNPRTVVALLPELPSE